MQMSHATDMAMRHVTQKTESCHTHVNETCDTYENEPSHICAWVMSYMREWVKSHRNASCHTHVHESCDAHCGPSRDREVLRCHYGGGGGNFAIVKRVLRMRIGMQKWWISGFLAARVGIPKRSNFLPRHLTTKQARMYIQPCSWAHGNSKKVGAVSYFGRVATVLVLKTRYNVFCDTAF